MGRCKLTAQCSKATKDTVDHSAIVSFVALRPDDFRLDRHCEERSDEAIQSPEHRTGLPRFARNDDVLSHLKSQRALRKGQSGAALEAYFFGRMNHRENIA